MSRKLGCLPPDRVSAPRWQYSVAVLTADLPSEVARALESTFASLYEALPGAVFERHESYLWWSAPSVPIPAFNLVWPVSDSCAAELPAAVARLDERGGPAAVQVRDTTPRVVVAAARLGMTERVNVPAMAIDADAVAAFSPAAALVRRAQARRELEVALDLFAAGFQTPRALGAALYSQAVAAVPGARYYVVYDAEGTAVSTAVGFATGPALGVFNVATLPVYRGRGFGAAATYQALADGFAAGARFGWLQSSPMGRPVFERMGFQTVDSYGIYTRPNGG